MPSSHVPVARAKQWLKDNNQPFSDAIPQIPSSHRFDNGALFGVEIPVVNSLDALEKTIQWLEHYELPCDRFNETQGSFLLPTREIQAMLALCAEKQIGMVFSLSPRPEYDPKASFYKSKFGLEQCRRLNNMDAITAALDEALRLADLGVRGLIVYDIGVLSLLKAMRAQGQLPPNMLFKASSHCMATNPLIAKILQDNGADSITVVHDASLAVLQEMRRLCPTLLLDVPIDVYADKGGYIRFNEIADIVTVAAPVMIKVGASAQMNPYDTMNDAIIKTKVKRVASALEHLQRGLEGQHWRFMDKSDPYRCLPDL